MRCRFPISILLTVLAGAFAIVPAMAAEALAAVAANFAKPAAELVARFGAETGHTVKVTLGSTGKLYAQIANGAPFDLLLAADQARPEQLVAQGLAAPDSRFTYASGRLVLVRADGGEPSLDFLKEAAFRHLAIGNPRLVPYGLAAEQAMAGLGLLEQLRPKLVLGENIGQTYAMVSTGNAQAGFVALSQVTGPHWLVPAGLHAPIHQDVVLLLRAANNEAARGFHAYLRSAEGRKLIQSFGYDTE
jgi:molybdate transport system substrate-binding protein